MLSTYLISLEGDFEKRQVLKERFPQNYNNFNLIDAIDGRNILAKEYFLKVLPFVGVYGRLMSPSELGCTLSHIQALKDFLKSGQERALIIEDDLIGGDFEIELISSLAAKLTENSLLICGGQNGLASRKWLFVKKKSDFYEVSPASYGNIFRTCCYVVTRSSAIAILKRHKNGVTLADKWSEFFVETDVNIYYVDLFDHPEDLSQSTIEVERNMQKERRSVFKFSSETYRRIIKFFRYMRDYLVGYRRMIF